MAARDDEREPSGLNDIRDFQPPPISKIVGQANVAKALEITVEASFAERKRINDFMICGRAGHIGAGEGGRPRTLIAVCGSLDAVRNQHRRTQRPAAVGDRGRSVPATNQHLLLKAVVERRLFIGGGKSVQPISVATVTLAGATSGIVALDRDVVVRKAFLDLQGKRP